MNDAALGGVLLSIPMGQLSAMALSGYLVARLGSKRLMIIASLLYPMALVGLGLAYSPWLLSVGLFFFGIAANMTNIAVNTQAVGVERLYGRSIMATFHGLWSLAGFFGGLISTLMVSVHIGTLTHFCIIFTVALANLLVMNRLLLPRDMGKRKKVSAFPAASIEATTASATSATSATSVTSVTSTASTSSAVVTEAAAISSKRGFKMPDRLIILLGVVVFGNLACEGTMFDWSGVYFKSVVQPPENLVRLGYVACMSTMALGRFLADSLVTRFGAIPVLRLSGMVTFTGLMLSVALPYLIPATIGFMLVGFGISSIVPVCYSMAGRSKSMSAGVAITTVSTIGFFGFLVGPPLIGFIAQALNLRWSFAIIACIGLMTTIIAPLLKKHSGSIN